MLALICLTNVILYIVARGNLLAVKLHTTLFLFLYINKVFSCFNNYYHTPTAMHAAAVHLLWYALIISTIIVFKQLRLLSSTLVISCILILILGLRWSTAHLTINQWWTPADISENLLIGIIALLIGVSHTYWRANIMHHIAYFQTAGLWYWVTQMRRMRTRTVIHSRETWSLPLTDYLLLVSLFVTAQCKQTSRLPTNVSMLIKMHRPTSVENIIWLIIFPIILLFGQAFMSPTQISTIWLPWLSLFLCWRHDNIVTLKRIATILFIPVIFSTNIIISVVMLLLLNIFNPRSTRCAAHWIMLLLYLMLFYSATTLTASWTIITAEQLLVCLVLIILIIWLWRHPKCEAN